MNRLARLSSGSFEAMPAIGNAKAGRGSGGRCNDWFRNTAPITRHPPSAKPESTPLPAMELIR